MPQRFWICLLILSLSSLTYPQQVRAQDDTSGQQLIEIRMNQCVYHAGDNLEWAAPKLDESSWLPAAPSNTIPPSPNIWLRCRADLSALRSLQHPAVQITAAAAYEVYLDGHLIGRNGNLETGNYSQNIVRSYPVPTELLAAPTSILALRQTAFWPDARTDGAIAILRAGDAPSLDAERARFLLAGITPILPYVIGYLVIGILGIAQLGLYYYDRSRRDLLLLSLVCIVIALLRLNEFCSSALVNYSLHLRALIWVLGNLYFLPYVCFFFALARRPVPILFWILIALDTAGNLLPRLATVTLTAAQAYWVLDVVGPTIQNISIPALMLTTLAPFAAMLPLSRLAPRMRELGVLCMVWGACDFIFQLGQLVFLLILHQPLSFGPWRLLLLESRAVSTILVLLALLLLLFRDQRRVTEERAILVGEMQAAAEIQRLMVPQTLEVAPGLSIEAVYLPAQEVGGDFYLCCVLPDGTQRVLLGDVSGKGAAAAMTAALLLGAAGRYEEDGPSLLMARLNQTLRSRRISGFTTCICADVQPCGVAVLVNAGHLTPYKKGVEIKMESGMPLGVALDGNYPETRLQLEPGDSLTFLSDGVVEAKAASGEMFGFDRTREISEQSARAIAEKARSFGQADDITVLTVSRVE